MGKKLKNIILYAGAEKSEFESIRDMINSSNREITTVFATLAILLIGVMMVLSRAESKLEKSMPIYVVAIVFSVILILLAQVFSRKYEFCLSICVYMALSVFFIYGIYIGTVSRPEEQTVTYMVMLILLPLIFITKPYRMIMCIFLYDIIFIIAAVLTKNKAVLSVDITDAVIFGCLGAISGIFVTKTKVKAFVLERKLRILSEMDQLTGLHNRNCYENRVSDYKKQSKKSVGCIYIDINGLHEMNNTEGHKAGDKMLQSIAEMMMDIFGEEDAYRIGGDEYVAFVKDISEKELEEKIKMFRDRVAEKSYHAAIGFHQSSVKDMDVSGLVKEAEKKMYADKRAYYQQMGNDRRNR